MAKNGKIDEFFDLEKFAKEKKQILDGLAEIAVAQQKSGSNVKSSSTLGDYDKAQKESLQQSSKAAAELARLEASITKEKEAQWKAQERLNQKAKENQAKKDAKDQEEALKLLNAESKKREIQIGKELAALQKKAEAAAKASQKEADYVRKHGEETTKLTRQVEALRVKTQELILTKGKENTITQASQKEYDAARKKLTDLQQTMGNHTQDVGRYGKAWDFLKSSWVAAGVALAAVSAIGGKVISFFKEGIQGTIDYIHMNSLLLNSVNQNIGAFTRLVAFRERMNKSTTFSRSEINAAIAQEMVMGRTEAQTKKMVETAMGLSKVLGIDVHAAMMQLNQTLEGSSGRLGRISGQVRNMTEEQLRNGEAIDVLNAKFGKFSTEGMDGLEGRLTRVDKLWAQFKRTISGGVASTIDQVLTDIVGSDEDKLQKKIATAKNLIDKFKEYKPGSAGYAYMETERENLKTYESQLRLLQARQKLLEKVDELATTKAGLKAGPENPEKDVWTDKSLTPGAYAVKRAKVMKSIDDEWLKVQEENEKKAIEFSKKAADEKIKQEEAAAKLRLTISKKSIAELWNLTLAQIKKEDGFKLLNETEQNQLILDRRKKFLDDQLKETVDAIKLMQTELKSMTGGTGAITIPVIVAQMTATGTAPKSMDKIQNNPEPPKSGIETEQTNLFGGTVSEGDKKLSGEAGVWEQRIQLAASAMQRIDEIVSASYANRFTQIQYEADADQVAKDRELKAAVGNTGKIMEINARYDAKEKEREKEKRRLAKEQAKYQKTSGIITAIINTAMGVTGALASAGTMGPVAAIIFAALNLAAGIAEIAIIASQPLPSYAKGRKGGKAEFANVGEKGTEAIVTKTGETFLTPSVTTTTFLPEGSKVIPHEELMNVAGMATSFMPQYQNSTLATERLESEIRGLHSGFRMLKLSIENKRENYLNITDGGIHRMTKEGNTWTSWVNKNVMP